METERSRIEALMRVGRWSDAVSRTRELLVEHPDDPDLLVALGIASMQTGDHPGALEAAQRAVVVEPSWAYAHSVLGDAHLVAGGDHDLAIEAYDEAIRLDPMGVGGYTGRSQATLHLLPKGKTRTKKAKALRSATIRRARRDADAAIRLDPGDPLAHAVLAKVHLADGKAFVARESARKALEIDPQHGLALQLFGLASKEVGDVRGASAAFVAAGKADPRSNTPTALLRGLRYTGPIGFFGAWIAMRMFLAGARAGGIALVVGGVASLLVGGFVTARWLARRRAHAAQLAPEAVRALAIDRSQRRSRFRRRKR